MDGCPPTLLVTRPQPQADEWAAALTARGFGACALPLLALEPVPDPQALQQAWVDLLGPSPPALAMFVSGGAVARFMAQRPAGAPWPPGVRAAATGPGTAAALVAAGVPASAVVQPAPDAPSFDSESLWVALRGEPWTGRQVLLVRGVDGRDWLHDQWQSAGARVTAVEAYRRVAARWSPTEQARARAAWAAPADHAWLFSSSQALAVLTDADAQAGGPGRPEAGAMPRRAIATHPRIAQRAQVAGFHPVHLAGPTLDAVAQALAACGPAGARSLQSRPS